MALNFTLMQKLCGLVELYVSLTKCTSLAMTKQIYSSKSTNYILVAFGETRKNILHCPKQPWFDSKNKFQRKLCVVYVLCKPGFSEEFSECVYILESRLKREKKHKFESGSNPERQVVNRRKMVLQQRTDGLEKFI